MSNIRFFALGGLGEIGKNMYVLEIDSDIFVFDCGKSEPTSEAFGYDSIIPDYKYLLANKDRIKGIFLSKFGDAATGGVPRLLKDFDGPFFATKYTIHSINERYLQNSEDDEKRTFSATEVSGGETIYFGQNKVEFFSLSSNVPDSIGISITCNITEDEKKSIIYLPDFSVDQNKKGHFKLDLNTLSRISSEGVLALLIASSGATKFGHISTSGKLDIALHKMLSHEGRTFLLMDAENISGMIDVIEACRHQRRKITIIGAKARECVETCMKLGYCEKYEDVYLPKTVLNDELRNSSNTVIIISGEGTEMFHAMQKICLFEDKHYFLNSKDNVVFLLNIPKKYEKVLANTWDDIWIDNANIIDFDMSLMPLPRLGSEDLKLLYSLLNPTYIIPITGDYRMIKSQAQNAIDYGYSEDKVIKLENGEVVSFTDGVVDPKHSTVEIGDILFAMESDSDINDYVAREREALTQEGFVVVSGMINLREKKLIDDIKIESYGFLPEYEQAHAYEVIRTEFKKIVEEHLSFRKVDYKDLRLDIKSEISKAILRETKKRPLLIPVIIDIS